MHAIREMLRLFTIGCCSAGMVVAGSNLIDWIPARDRPATAPSTSPGADALATAVTLQQLADRMERLSPSNCDVQAERLARCQRLAGLEEQRAQLDARLAETQSRMETLEAMRAKGREHALIQLVRRWGTDLRSEGAQRDEELRTRLSPLLMEDRALRVRFGQDHPKVQELTKKIEAIRELYAPGPNSDPDPINSYLASFRCQWEQELAARGAVGRLCEEERLAVARLEGNSGAVPQAAGLQGEGGHRAVASSINSAVVTGLASQSTTQVASRPIP